MLDLWLLYLHLASSLPARKYLLITLHLSHFHHDDDDDHNHDHHDDNDDDDDDEDDDDHHHDHNHDYGDGDGESDDYDNDDDGNILPIQMSQALIGCMKHIFSFVDSTKLLLEVVL